MFSKVSIFKIKTIAALTFTAIILPFQVSSAASTHHLPQVTHLVEEGLLEKEFINSLQPNEDLTRGELAHMIARSLGMNTNNESELPFSDMSKENPYYESIAVLVDNDVMNGYSDKTFQPNENVTRAQVAKMITKAYDLGIPKNVVLPFHDVKENHWAAAYIASLYENEIVEGITEFQFGPSENLTFAQAAIILDRASQIQKVHSVEQTKVEELAISEVVALNEEGRYLEISFNQPVSSLERTQFTIYDASSKARKGVQEVELINDGNKAIITMFPNAELAKLRDYSLQLRVEGNTAEYQLHREESYTKVKITDVDVKDREITFAHNNQTKTFTVLPSVDFDFVEAYNQKVNLWFDGEKNVTKIEIDEFEKLKKKQKYLSKFDLNEYLFVEEVQESEMIGINQKLPVDTFDLFIKKDKMALLTDVKKGDLLLFNYDDQVAEICTNIVEGKIENVYDSGIEVNGEVYDYNDSEYIKGDETKEFNSKAASKMEGKKVTLFLDKDDELNFVK